MSIQEHAFIGEITKNWGNAQNVCVIGAGTMGSGIAAHLANIGFKVTLLDLTRASIDDAFSRSKQVKPPHFYTHEKAAAIRLGSIEENLEWVKEADWVCEAIIERLDAKKELLAEIQKHLKPDAMISTNTSGLEIDLLAEDLEPSVRARFIGTHFFNPPRYLKLLELIPTADTDPTVVSVMTKFLEERVARRVIVARDTPGFIANRFGMWAMFHAVHTAEKLRLSVEQVDAITGAFLGRPRSASFRLNDLVGMDIMVDIAQNLLKRCPNDPFKDSLRTPKSVATLLERGWIGEKVGQGYYRKEGKELLALDLGTLAYRNLQPVNFPSLDSLAKLPIGERLGIALELRDEVGEFLRNYLIPVLRYADYLKEEISYGVQDFDRVMKWGFGWQLGPFELADAIGLKKLNITGDNFYLNGKQRAFDASYVAMPSEPQYITIDDLAIVKQTDTFSLRDMGDGVKAIALRTKMGTITPALVADLTQLLEDPKYDKLVLTSEAKAFSVGYDLNFFIERINAVDVNGIDLGLKNLQKLGELMEQRSIVAAVHGYCLGAGLELALSCSIIAAHPETQIGLPESKVGLLPGGRGTALTRVYNQASAKRLAEMCTTLAEGTVAANPEQARSLGILRNGDVTIFHPDRLLFDAKKLAQGASPSVRPAWRAQQGPLVGMIDQSLRNMREEGKLTEYDQVIGEKLKIIYAKCDTYEQALERERSEFLELCFKALTNARIKHMLETGKPLRN